MLDPVSCVPPLAKARHFSFGRVKFMFPNGHAIYLHDTPSKNLFSRGRRAYSHGRIRVHQPLTLARHLLGTQNWDDAEINRVVKRGWHAAREAGGASAGVAL